MKKLLFAFLFSSSLFAMSPGDKAPDFKLLGQDGKLVSLSSLKKPVMLEWFNDGCPFVRKHYDSNNMQDTQKFFKEETGGTWVSIVSSAKGKQGHLSSSSVAKDMLEEESSKADHMLLDLDGKVGQLYGAKTTPQMVYIGEDGIVKYYGAIDSIASAAKSDIKKAVNYVKEAVKDLKSSGKVKVAKSKPYGCGVKY
ncbi:putative exported protein [Halobacteriovorax marinus SJ]|uniref:Exported protein n=1 Tax=Halobacteriovorax marinus (strain ATCC BAA-682 / DSM 15412 / SJ) TaxID=862908 RepID=E1WX89_HALMS|nr:redoxin family protein [Halobacteriovorax marinus]CBW25790.1 putative exported protein [Halobacteriovorax marinus SJ]